MKQSDTGSLLSTFLTCLQSVCVQLTKHMQHVPFYKHNYTSSTQYYVIPGLIVNNYRLLILAVRQPIIHEQARTRENNNSSRGNPQFTNREILCNIDYE